MSEEYKKFLNWCEGKWTQEHKIQKLLSKLSNDDIDFLKEQYETCLNADLKAILVELQLEIEESCICTYEVTKLIQQKINELKENTDGNK